MLPLELDAIIDTDYPVLTKVSKSTLEMVARQHHRFRGSVRVSTRRIYTSEAFQERKERVQSLRLP